jgi:predicted DNA-binding transcriptional regulator AlpA
VGRRVDVTNLVGASEIAERLGVKRPQVVHDWRRRHAAFPKPVAHLRQALVWNWPDVERWARATGRI